MDIETHPADAFPTHIPSRSDFYMGCAPLRTSHREAILHGMCTFRTSYRETIFTWDVHLKETTEVK